MVSYGGCPSLTAYISVSFHRIYLCLVSLERSFLVLSHETNNSKSARGTKRLILGCWFTYFLWTVHVYSSFLTPPVDHDTKKDYANIELNLEVLPSGENFLISLTCAPLSLCLAKFGDIMVTLLWFSTSKQQKQNLQSSASAILGYNAFKSKLRFFSYRALRALLVATHEWRQ